MEPWLTAVIVAGGAFAGSLVGHLLPFWHTSRNRKHQFQVEGYNAIVAAEALIEKADRDILELDRGQLIDLIVITKRILPFINKKKREGFEAKIFEIREKAGIAIDAAASLRTSKLMPMSLTAGTMLGTGAGLNIALLEQSMRGFASAHGSAEPPCESDDDSERP